MNREGIVSLSADNSTEDRLTRNSLSSASLRRKCMSTKRITLLGKTTSERTDSQWGEGASTLGHVVAPLAQWLWIQWGSRCAGCTPSEQTPDSSHQAGSGTVAVEVLLPSPSLPHYQCYIFPPSLQLTPVKKKNIFQLRLFGGGGCCLVALLLNKI